MHILTDTDRCTLSLETLISTEWKLRNPIVCIAYDINDLRIKFICMNGKYLEISVLSPGCTGASTPPTCSLTPELLNIKKQFQYNAIYIHMLKKINIMKEKNSTLQMNERMNEWMIDRYIPLFLDGCTLLSTLLRTSHLRNSAAASYEKVRLSQLSRSPSKVQTRDVTLTRWAFLRTLQLSLRINSMKSPYA